MARFAAGCVVARALAAGCSGGTSVAPSTSPAPCSPAPSSVVTDPGPVADRSLVLPLPLSAPTPVSVVDGVLTVGSLVLEGDGVSLLAWGDLDADGHDDLVVEEGGSTWVVPGSTSGRHAVPSVGTRVSSDLRYVWPDDLDGRPGADFVVPHRELGSTQVWSGARVLERRDARGMQPARRIRGLPRSYASLSPGARPETLLLVPSPPAIRFADRKGVVLAFPGGPSSRVEQVVVEDGRVGLRIDRRIAWWDLPIRC